MHDKGTQTLSAAAPTATTTNTSATPARNYTGVLRYADPKDLPGFPILGVQNDEAAASAAASLGWANRRPVEIWKPDSSASASAAAFLAKDFKMSPSWQPSTGYDPKSPGAQAAALATQASTKAKVAPPASQPRSNGHASSASMSAVYASRRNQYSPPEDMSRNKGSLAAAKDAMAHFSTRPRSTSTPQPLRDNRRRDMSGSENALSAATIAHRPFSTTQIPIEEAGAVPYTTLPRKMFTATPPVRMEVDEQKRADMLHASAVAMAKTMYKQQQRMIDTTQVARQRELSNSKSESQLKTAVNLQEAAYKAAQERLNKLHDEHQKNRNYQEYYADPNAQPARRSTVLSKLRRRASSDGDLDRQQSERIRQQMSLFSSNLSKVDEQKRTKDREALLAVAQRNVRARLQGIDKKVYEDTGKITTSNKSDWESRATAAAKARHEARSNPNRGKIDIGGGKYLDAEEINAIAAKRLKPMLDEMDEMAAKERERQENLRLEAEEKREAAERERVKEQEIKNIHKKLVEQDRQEVKERQRHEKEEEKERKQHAKEEEKARKEEEKASKAAERKIAKEEKEEEKRKSREKTRKRPEEIMVPSQTEDDTRRITEPASGQPSQQAAETSEVQPSQQAAETSEVQPKQNNLSSPTSPTSPNSPASKMKGWLKARLSRPRRKSAGDGDSDGAEKRGFIGGIALRQREEEAIQSNSSLEHRSSSMRDVALAGKETEPSAAAASSVTTHADLAASGRARRDSLGVSIDEGEEGSTAGEEEHYEEALDHHDFEGLSPPSALQNLNKPKSASPTRDSRFREMVD